MRKIVSIVAFLALIAFPAYSGSKIISVNPVGIIFGVPNVMLENVKPSGLNPVLGGSLYLYSGGGWSTFGLGLTAGVRKYLEEGKSGEGLYVGGYGGLGILSAKYGGESSNSLLFSVTGAVGYKVIFSNKYVVGLEAGLSIYLNSGVTIGGVSLGAFSGVAPYGALELGIKL